MNKHVLHEPPPKLLPYRLLREIQRQILESPSLRALQAATSGPATVARMMADFKAEDDWENEGGACAYLDR